MGKIKYIKDVEQLFKKSPVVDFNSITRLIRSRKDVKQYHKQLIKNLVSKGRLKKLTKGFYTIHNDASFSVFCFKPSYLGLQDALSFHELWEQETIPVIITSRRVRQGLRRVMDSNILIRRIDKKYIFGLNYEKQGEFYFPYSDIEKTFIDMIYFKQSLSQEVKDSIKEKIDNKRLISYLNKYPEKFRKRVLKYL